MPTLQFNKQFVDSFEKLPPDRQKKAMKALATLAEDPTYPSLHKHKFHASENRWTIRSGGQGDRIVFEEILPGVYEILDIGAHDKVYRRMNRK